MRWLLRLLAGVAAMAVAGYLVAALWLFPAPLLPNERKVAQVVGMAEEDAMSTLSGAGLVGDVASRETHPRWSQGTVIWQDPPAGVAVPRGDTVHLVVSAGLPRVSVPDVHGYDTDLAQRIILAAGLRIETVDTVAMKTPGAPPGTIGGTTPRAGESVPSGRSVTLHLVQ